MNDTKYSTGTKSESRPDVMPNVDIIEEKERYLLKADMPGVSREKLDITLDNNILTISGEVSFTAKPEYVYQEYDLRNYRRSFSVNETINTKEIDATLENGVLTLILPKSEKSKPRSIEIKVAS